MRFEVKETCCRCGLCNYCCPQLFSLGEKGIAHAENKEPSPLEAAAAAFVSARCPGHAIVCR